MPLWKAFFKNLNRSFLLKMIHFKKKDGHWRLKKKTFEITFFRGLLTQAIAIW